MELELYHYALAIGGGFVAGIMNTLAGYGSIITLTILMDVIGLPANVANGTNRVNVLANGVAGVLGYKKSGKLSIDKGKSIMIVVSIGAVLGVITAVNVSNENFRDIFRYLVAVLFLAIVVNPKRWVREQSEVVDLPLWKLLLIYLPIGFYGGFIQMGMGIVFLMATVLISKYTILQANALKLVVLVIYTIMSLAIFHYNGLVDWKIGAVLSIGTAIGAYLTASYASQLPKANLYAYRFLVMVVLIVLLRTFGVFDLIGLPF